MVILAIFVSGSLFSQRWITLLSDEWYLPVGVNNVMDIKYPGRAEWNLSQNKHYHVFAYVTGMLVLLSPNHVGCGWMDLIN